MLGMKRFFLDTNSTDRGGEMEKSRKNYIPYNVPAGTCSIKREFKNGKHLQRDTNVPHACKLMKNVK